MLLTRCPSCRTTFRITADALHKAEGQVRCGRCSAVFDAYAELSDQPSEARTDSGAARSTTAGRSDQSVAATEQPALPGEVTDASGADTATPVQAAEPDTGPSIGTDVSDDAGDSISACDDTVTQSSAPEAGAGGRPDDAGATDENDQALEHLSVAEVMEEIRLSSDDGVDEPMAAEAEQAAVDGSRGEAAATAHVSGDHDGAISAEEVDAVLEREPRNQPPTLHWIPATPSDATRSQWWRYAAAVAALVLGAQLIHHFRADLAARPPLGAWLTEAYALLGTELVPSWDLHQYQIMDWVATAEAGNQGEGSLNITARILNRGPQPQPFPQVHLELKDRWDTPVGSRIFHPREYLAGDAAGPLMAPGETARAELEVIDPGEDAYGFQLDVCVGTASGVLRCAADEVFR